MTYCVAIALDDGIVFTTDSRTNAGVDRVSTYSKMHNFGVDGERQLVLLTSGNLATTQAVIEQLKRDIDNFAPRNLLTVRDLVDAAEYVGEISRAEQSKHSGGPSYEASFLIGGQIGSMAPVVLLIYPEGNHITPSKYAPFLQIGESKYGKPILDRIITPETSLDTAAVCSMVSMGSTMRSNVTVGPPIELLLYRRDSLILEPRICLEDDSPYLRELSDSWDRQLKKAFMQLPPIQWATAQKIPPDEPNITSL